MELRTCAGRLDKKEMYAITKMIEAARWIEVMGSVRMEYAAPEFRLDSKGDLQVSVICAHCGNRLRAVARIRGGGEGSNE
jgi:hypothetical protein